MLKGRLHGAAGSSTRGVLDDQRRPALFVVAPGHEDPEHEEVLTLNDSYLIVREKSRKPDTAIVGA